MLKLPVLSVLGQGSLTKVLPCSARYLEIYLGTYMLDNTLQRTVIGLRSADRGTKTIMPAPRRHTLVMSIQSLLFRTGSFDGRLWEAARF